MSKETPADSETEAPPRRIPLLGSRPFPYRLVGFLGVILLLVLTLSLVDLSPNLRRVELAVLSGPVQGHYHEVVGDLDLAADREGGSIENIATSGSVENLRRLADAADDCDVQFALVQDGVPAPDGADLHLVGRLRKSESMFFVGRNAEQVSQFAQLRGMRIAVGLKGSGTDFLARRILESEDFRGLGLSLENFATVEEQLSALASPTGPPLGVFVVDEDAPLMRRAIRDLGLQLASFEHLDVLARRYSFLDHGRIGAGQYDPINVVPKGDTRVFRVGTLVLSNGCASHAEELGLLTLLGDVLPDFLDYNRQTTGSHLYRRSKTSRRFLDNAGPDMADEYVPWLVAIMPPSNWVYVIMVISIFINLTTTWHRFRLWRLDANTDKADQVLRAILGAELTPAEIRELSPDDVDLGEDALAQIDAALKRIDRLRARCRKQANSLLVPMGQEWIYRYTEQQMEETLTAMRIFRGKIENRS